MKCPPRKKKSPSGHSARGTRKRVAVHGGKRTPGRTPKVRSHRKPVSSTYLLLRTSLVTPESIKRSTVTQQKISGGRARAEKWSGTLTKKNRATIEIRYRYVRLSSKNLKENKAQIESLLETHVNKVNAAFVHAKGKQKPNTISHTAQIFSGRIVDKHRGRIISTGKVGTVIYAPSTARKKKIDKGQYIERTKKNLAIAVGNARNTLLDSIQKMLDYKVIPVKEARKRHLAREQARKHKKNIFMEAFGVKEQYHSKEDEET